MRSFILASLLLAPLCLITLGSAHADFFSHRELVKQCDAGNDQCEAFIVGALQAYAHSQHDAAACPNTETIASEALIKAAKKAIFNQPPIDLPAVYAVLDGLGEDGLLCEAD